MQVTYDGIDKGTIYLNDIGRRNSFDVYSRHIAQDMYIHHGDGITLVDTSYTLMSMAQGMLKKLSDEGIITVTP